jgi:hypothetical protein
VAAKTSAFVIRPPTPLPVTAAMSTPDSRASLRTIGLVVVADPLGAAGCGADGVLLVWAEVGGAADATDAVGESLA